MGFYEKRYSSRCNWQRRVVTNKAISPSLHIWSPPTSWLTPGFGISLKKKHKSKYFLNCQKVLKSRFLTVYWILNEITKMLYKNQSQISVICGTAFQRAVLEKALLGNDHLICPSRHYTSAKSTSVSKYSSQKIQTTTVHFIKQFFFNCPLKYCDFWKQI